MAVASVSLGFLSRSNCVAQALVAASPRILSASPKSVCGSPTAPTPRSFAGLATPKTPARSPFSAAASPASAAGGSTSPFFGAGSPVWSDFEMAARASAEASAQLARVALPSAMSAREHCLARLARRSSSKNLETIDSDSDKTSDSSDNTLSSMGQGANQPRLGLGQRGTVAATSGSGEVQLPVVLGNTRNQATQALRKLHSFNEDLGRSEVDDVVAAAALVRENFLRRRAIIAERAALMAMP
mmetsp:Transcript_77648/g.170041  ORF Transcript_77648/g.170041 Transcript_77648/m.170041 type:complete len:243 (+) Transcript_77648:81-809(+)